MATERDRRSVGLTPAAQRHVEDLIALGWFEDAQDLARFAMAYAIRRGVGAGAVEGQDTRWAIGNSDPDGEIQEVVRAVHPDNPTPVRLIEHLTNEGLRLLAERVDAGERDVAALLT